MVRTPINLSSGIQLPVIERILLLAGIVFATLTVSATSANAAISFRDSVLPILTDHCFQCHGPDAQTRKANLRLDRREDAVRHLKSGFSAISPGSPEMSELVHRVTTTDSDDVMPPLKSDNPLTAKEKSILSQWVSEGAAYDRHWAFVPPSRPDIPETKTKNWARNVIDHFVLERLEDEGLKPSPPAKPHQLARRTSFDLTGLPPSSANLEWVETGDFEINYGQWLDQLLESPHYGERMAVDWLDAARFADTHGYHLDSARDMTRWRDWVIQAFNSNMPFDQFTIEQLAGDLLPNATLDQRIATGFNRNHMINYEGGAFPEEYRVAYTVDRVNTTSTVFMGLTVGCAQCHDHKYDPISQKDYYSLYAFFNNLPEKGLDGRNGNAAPLIQLGTEETRRISSELESKLDQAKVALKKAEQNLPESQREWESTLAAQGLKSTSNSKPILELTTDTLWEKNVAPIRPSTNLLDRISVDSKWLRSDQTIGVSFWLHCTKQSGRLFSTAGISKERKNIYVGLSNGNLRITENQKGYRSESKLPTASWIHIAISSGKDDSLNLFINGKEQSLVDEGVVQHSTFGSSDPVLLISSNISDNASGAAMDRLVIQSQEITQKEADSLYTNGLLEYGSRSEETRSPEPQKKLAALFKGKYAKQFQQAKKSVEKADLAQRNHQITIPSAMVMQEMKVPRDTFILNRGEYNKPGEQVTADFPSSFPSTKRDYPKNRLGLAQWLVSVDNPLTARVIVNRIWQMYFGVGLVKTAEDFGVRGEKPSHPKLLDWLAVELIESGWNIKRLHRLIATSATYRQTATSASALYERDPENRLLARGPRLRLQAEFLRDQALAVSGLLDRRIGGKSVSPYQPAGLWAELSQREDSAKFSAQFFEQDQGSNLFRRSLYTFWKRTSPPPNMTVLDAPNRERCTVRRATTNTPLQALVLMNDPTFVESARVLATKLLTKNESDLKRLQEGFKLATSRDPSAKESEILIELLHEQKSFFDNDASAAHELIHVGDYPTDNDLSPALLASWTVVANAILNLDETINK